MQYEIGLTYICRLAWHVQNHRWNVTCMILVVFTHTIIFFSTMSSLAVRKVRAKPKPYTRQPQKPVS